MPTSDDFGTATTSPAWMYPLDGARYAVGTDPEHLGGDVWAADAAIKVMRHDADWDGMLVSLPSIDKMAHMWGTDDTVPRASGTTCTSSRTCRARRGSPTARWASSSGSWRPRGSTTRRSSS